MKFNLLTQSDFARRAELELNRGKIQTPAFMPVGTNGTVKGMTVEDLESTNSEIILGNTFHLMLRPGDEVIRDLGGLHKFSNWNKPILTDSGGFQVWSLGDLVKITEDGVEFSSPYDGKRIFMSPEDSIQIQQNLGSDIVMAFDECTDYPSTHEEAKKSMELSMRWAKRCKDFHKSDSALFGIVQGGMYKDLREISLNKLIKIDFDGIALGGLSVGESKKEKKEILEFMSDKLPKNKSRIVGMSTRHFKKGLQPCDKNFDYRALGCSMINMYYVLTGSFNHYVDPIGGFVWDILPGLNLALENKMDVYVDDKKYNGEFLSPEKRYKIKILNK